jgi:hypothetical protein
MQEKMEKANNIMPKNSLVLRPKIGGLIFKFFFATITFIKYKKNGKGKNFS